MAKPPRGKKTSPKPKAKASAKRKPVATKQKPAKQKPAAKAKKAAKAKTAPPKAKPKAAKAKQPAAKQPVARRKPAARQPAHKAPAKPRARKTTSQLSLPGFSEPSDGEPDAEPSSADPARASQIAQLATARAADPSAPVRLASITAPSGTLAIFDVALMAYLPRAALDPLMVCVDVPADRPLDLIGVRVGSGRFADCWDHVAIELATGARDVVRTRKLGEAAVDFARLLFIDRAAIDAWQHEDSLDQLADVVFWGRDEAALAKALGARKLADGHGRGWRDLSLADAEARADRAAQLKADHAWQLTIEVRPHSHHFHALAAARASGHGAGVIELAGARAALVLTTWGEGVFPVVADVDAQDRPVRIRVLLARSDLGRRSAA